MGSTREIYELANRHGIEIPITEQVYRILYQGLDPRSAVHNLLQRHAKAEADDSG